MRTANFLESSFFLTFFKKGTGKNQKNRENYSEDRKMKEEEMMAMKNHSFLDGRVEDFMFSKKDREFEKEVKNEILGMNKGFWLVTGPSCAGKSFLARCISNELQAKRKKVLRLNTRQLIGTLLGIYQGKRDEAEFMKIIKACKLLILDELEEFMGLESTINVLGNFLSEASAGGTGILLLGLEKIRGDKVLMNMVMNQSGMKDYHLTPLDRMERAYYVKDVLGKEHVRYSKQDLKELATPENMGTVVGNLEVFCMDKE